MTAYFDKVHERISACYAATIDDIESDLVFDVSVASAFDGFPEDLAKKIDAAVLAKGSATLPVNHVGRAFDTFEEHRDSIHALCWELHTIFHELSARGFSDDPRSPLRKLYARAEERREVSVAIVRGD